MAYTLIPLCSHSAAATSSWVDSGFEAHRATSAPPAWRASTRFAVSVVTWRQAAIFSPWRGRSFSNRSRISPSTPISVAAQSMRARPRSTRPRSFTSQSISAPRLVFVGTGAHSGAGIAALRTPGGRRGHPGADPRQQPGQVRPHAPSDLADLEVAYLAAHRVRHGE